MFKQYVHQYGATSSPTTNGSFKVFEYQKSKVGLLNSKLVESFGLGDAGYVSLYYDTKTSRIGLKFHKEKEGYAVKLSSNTKRGNHKTRIICLNGFISQFNPPINLKKDYSVKKASKKARVDMVIQL